MELVMDMKRIDYSEALSAWFDGEELPTGEEEQSAVLTAPEARMQWGTYALIGAALRGEALSLPNDGFVERLFARLDQEASSGEQASLSPLLSSPAQAPEVSANDPKWQWGVVAALVFVSLIGAFFAALPTDAPPATVLQATRTREPPSWYVATPAGPFRSSAPREAAISNAPLYLSIHHPLQPVSRFGLQRSDGRVRPAVSERSHR